MSQWAVDNYMQGYCAQRSWDSWGSGGWDSKGKGKGPYDNGYGKGKPKTYPDVENPGLDPNKKTYAGYMKGVPNSQTGYTFVFSEELTAEFGMDGFVHTQDCPWLHKMEVYKGSEVLI